MGITFSEFLEGKTVKAKSGEILKIESVKSASDIVGRVVFPGEKDHAGDGMSRFIKHVCLLDIETDTLRSSSVLPRQ